MIVALLAMTSYVKPGEDYITVPECDIRWPSSGEHSNCCKAFGYDHNYRGGAAKCARTSLGYSNIDIARRLDMLSSRLNDILKMKNKYETYISDAVCGRDTCRDDHKKYVDSMGRTKKIIEGLLANKVNGAGA